MDKKNKIDGAINNVIDEVKNSERLNQGFSIFVKLVILVAVGFGLMAVYAVIFVN